MKHTLSDAKVQEIFTRASHAVEVQRQIVKRYQRQFRLAGIYQGPIDGSITDGVALAYYEYVGSDDLADFWEVVGWEVTKEISK